MDAETSGWNFHEEQLIGVASMYVPHIKYKGENNNFIIVLRRNRQGFNQVVKVKITRNGANDYLALPDRRHKGKHLHSVAFLPKMRNLNLTMRISQTKPNKNHSTK